MNICVVSTFLTIIIKATMNICVWGFVPTCVLVSGLKVELLDIIIRLCLIFFEELQNYFLKCPHYFTFPPAMNEDSVSLYVQHTVVCLFYYGHTSGYEIVSHGCDLHIPVD